MNPAVPKQVKKIKEFDFSKSVARKVALRISYLGQKYHGFAGTLKDKDSVPTIEGELFKALMTCRLIPSPEDCEWSKAGRTDKGVSGFGQVVSLWVRTKLPRENTITMDWAAIKALKAERSAAETCMQNYVHDDDDDVQQIDEFPYIELLNRLLPNEIRILAWTPVPTAFDARFSCQWRKYKYFFPSANMQLDKMQEAAQLFIGTHDCRYICKIDTTKPIGANFFIRDIYESHIEKTSNPAFSVFVVRGRAFLWHQVRNMMALLFMVGRGLEEPEIVSKMLCTSDDVGKPNYDMAPDAPLVLIDCGYQNLHWKTRTKNNSGRTYKVMQDQWNEGALYVLQLDTLMEEYVAHQPSKDDMMDVSFKQPLNKHVSLLKRGRSDSVQAVREKRVSRGKD